MSSASARSVISRSGVSSSRRADLGAEGRVAGLEGEQRPAAEALGEPPGLGGLAAPLAALEGDEVAGHASSSGSAGRRRGVGAGSGRWWLRFTSVNGVVRPDTISAPSCSSRSSRGSGTRLADVVVPRDPQRQRRQHAGAHDDEPGEPQREPHAGHGDRDARDRDARRRRGRSLSRSSSVGEERPDGEGDQHAEPHERVERARRSGRAARRRRSRAAA